MAEGTAGGKACPHHQNTACLDGESFRRSSGIWVAPTHSLHGSALPNPDHCQHFLHPLSLRRGRGEALRPSLLTGESFDWGEGQDGNR